MRSSARSAAPGNATWARVDVPLDDRAVRAARTHLHVGLRVHSRVVRQRRMPKAVPRPKRLRDLRRPQRGPHVVAGELRGVEWRSGRQKNTHGHERGKRCDPCDPISGGQDTHARPSSRAWWMEARRHLVDGELVHLGRHPLDLHQRDHGSPARGSNTSPAGRVPLR